MDLNSYISINVKSKLFKLFNIVSSQLIKVNGLTFKAKSWASPMILQSEHEHHCLKIILDN